MSTGPTAAGGDGFAAALAARREEFAGAADEQAVALRLFDTVACAIGAERLAGFDGTAAGKVASLLTGPDTPGGATVWATGHPAPVDDAAFRNAVSARYLDLNDTYVAAAIVHPSDLVAALVAQAEAVGCPWRRLVEAVTIGYEVLCRLAEQARLRERGWDGSTLTPLASAVAASWLLGLTDEQAAHAVTVSCLDSATLRRIRAGRLSEWKAVASARGAVKGLFAARAAGAGLRAPADAFGGADGFFARVSGPMVFDPADQRPRLSRTLVKRYPAQIFVQVPLRLAADLAGELPGGAAARIAEVTVRTFRTAVDLVGDRPTGPGLNRETADHSMSFCVAAVLVTGGLAHRDVAALLSDRRVLDLAGRVRTVEDPTASAVYPDRLPAEMEVRLDDGSVLTRRAADAPGVDPASLRDKAEDLWPDAERSWPWRLPGTPPAFALSRPPRVAGKDRIG